MRDESHTLDPDINDDVDQFYQDLYTLASSRPDTWLNKRRTVLVERTQRALQQQDEATRRVLLECAKDITGSSLNAYRRIVPIYAWCLRTAEAGDLHANDEARLWSALARLLDEAGDAQLLDDTVAILSQPPPTESDRQRWTSTLYTLASTFALDSSDNTDNAPVLPAIALGSALDSATAADPSPSTTPVALQSNDWTALLLSYTLAVFTSENEMALVRTMLQHIPDETFQATVCPALLLKVKSHPDKAWPTVTGWIRHFVTGTSETTVVSPDWLAHVVKCIQSPKSTIRDAAVRLVQVWARAASAGTTSNGVVLQFSQALAASNATLVPSRVSMYECLTELAEVVDVSRPDTDSSIVDSLGSIVDGLLHLLAKVPATKADPKVVIGMRALLAWTLLLRNVLGSDVEDDDNNNAKVYRQALHTMKQPLLLVAKPSTDTAGPILSLLLSRVHPDTLEPLVKDWFVDLQLQKAMETWVEVANTKKTLYWEGLACLYLTVLHSAVTSQPIPSWAHKVIGTGGNDACNTKTTCFLYSTSNCNGLSRIIVARIVALYVQLASQRSDDGNASESFVNAFPRSNSISAAASALAVGVISITTGEDLSRNAATDVAALLALWKTILTYKPSAAQTLTLALAAVVNQQGVVWDKRSRQENATREARESEISGLARTSFPIDGHAVRRVAHLLREKCPDVVSVWILMHVNSSLKTEGHQRTALVFNTLRALQSTLDRRDNTAIDVEIWAAEIVSWTGHSQSKDSAITSGVWHNAVLSLTTSLGGVASNCSSELNQDGCEVSAYTVAYKLCHSLGARWADRLRHLLSKVEGLSDHQIAVYQTPFGTLYASDDEKPAVERKGGKKHLTEEEAWEIQMKTEMAEKNETTNSSTSRPLSVEEQRIVDSQDNVRGEISALLEDDYCRVLHSIRTLCASDIELGNTCLPAVFEIILQTAVASCPAISKLRTLQDVSFVTLTTLATCVYEIHEIHAPTLAQALMISCRKGTAVEEGIFHKKEGRALSVSPLPSPCASAACVIYEMDHFGEPLSGSSFQFLFPIVYSSLLGPRTPPGCEAAVRVLDRHTLLLSGGSSSELVTPLRKDMAAGLLGLLKYDRAQTFQDPTAYEALVACYHIDDSSSFPLSANELAPLLDERGALGGKNCRKAAMLALAKIASVQRKTVKSNPLVENRIWLNCFEEDDDVRSEAQKAWAIVHEAESFDCKDTPRPSPLYAAPLLPLLNNRDKSIVHAAASAFAHAMALHPNSVSRNVETLCKLYIEAFPTARQPALSENLLKAANSLPAPAKKKPILAGLSSKKVPPKKSALAVAGIGKQRTSKKKAASSALLKPKEERTLDPEALESQFTGVRGPSKTEDQDSPDRISTRLGVLSALAATTSSTMRVEMDETTLKLLTSFLMAYGIADSNDGVKGAARNTLRDVVASNGGSDEAIAFLLPHLEAVLRTGVANEAALSSLPIDKVPRDTSASDRRKEGAVVALGSVALHLKGPANEEKVDGTIAMLISALKTPSEEVQTSIADALTKLMKKGRTQERIESILTSLLHDCLFGATLAQRRGAAYGLSAAIKGSGITALKKYDIVRKLEEVCVTGEASGKEGSLFAIELLSERLGLLFEPYVIVLLPALLKSFSDTSDHVRIAASHTVGLIMSKLSAHGVKLVMPAVLKAFEDPAWRTKQASIHMLGSMSHLAPKQLASALPKVVPKLTEAFSDTHPKVKQSAQEALDEISTVIRNPEISSISSILLKALTDPADNTVKALEGLIETEFLHAIDAPSLALIVPILHRGLRDRGANSKRYGGLIAGNICTMINDPKDFVPYLPTLLPDLQTALLDPIPDVRSTAAKALGSLTRSLGEYILPDLRPWLIRKLRDHTCSSAERSGAAQGLTEVLVASGSAVVDDAMRNEILPLRSYPQASTREGVLWMLTFLPPALGQGFTPLIDVSLPALINGLSDDSEPVRDVAMRAGRVLIRSHGKVHVDKILPSLELGLGDEDYRIRVSSLSLLGDLLSTIGGTSMVKGDGDTQDDIRKAERAQAQIALALGPETRRRVYSGLYMARNDSTHAVRTSAIQVWKTVVSVTARTLRDILPVLVSQIIANLASGHEERTEVAGRCLGDVVSKLGDSVLPQIIPVLRNALYDGDTDTKRGVCVGLTEVINRSTKDQIIKFIEIIVKVVQDALSDDDEVVRQMAAASFQSLHSLVGSRAFDEVVPSLMVSLEVSENDEVTRTKALNGLTGILSIRSRELLPYIVPRLIEHPISANHARALAGISQVTGDTIYHHFSSIIPALLGELAKGGYDEEDAVRQCSSMICASVHEAGVNWLIREVVSKCGSDKASLRTESCRMLEDIVRERAEKRDFYEQIPIILRELLYRLNDEDTEVLKATNSAFSTLTKFVPAEELVKHIEFMRNLLASMVSDARRRKGGVGDGEFLLPGFNRPKGLEPLLPIYQRGILYGTPSIREVAAAGLGEVLTITSTKYLVGPFIIKMTGPLLRIVGDRNPSNVKIAILKTLGLILVKGGPALRAFVPQFQTTFVKALSDPSRQVRLEAIAALSLLMPISSRVDPLIKELVSGAAGKAIIIEGVAATAVQAATLQALATVLKIGGAKAKLPSTIPSALDASEKLLESHDEGVRHGAAKVLGEACALLGSESSIEVLRSIVVKHHDNSSDSRHGKACAIRYILSTKDGSAVEEAIPSLKKLVCEYLYDDKSIVRESACVALGAVIGRSPDTKVAFRDCESVLLKLLGNSKEPMEIHRAIARGFCVALMMIKKDQRIETMGLPLLNECLQQALSGSQRVQFAYNDVLWLALDVPSGQDGLKRYSGMSLFDNSRSMTTLHGKVLSKINRITILDD